MRVLILSDSHKETNRIDNILASCGKVDHIIFCGDVDDDADYIGYVSPAMMPIVRVTGNNDYFPSYPYRAVFALDGIRFYVTHGHLDGARSGHAGLIRAAKEADCSVVIYGHTHRAVDKEENGIRLINPGAVSGSKPSFAVMTIEGGPIQNIEFKSI